MLCIRGKRWQYRHAIAVHQHGAMLAFFHNDKLRTHVKNCFARGDGVAVIGQLRGLLIIQHHAVHLLQKQQ